MLLDVVVGAAAAPSGHASMANAMAPTTRFGPQTALRLEVVDGTDIVITGLIGARARPPVPFETLSTKHLVIQQVMATDQIGISQIRLAFVLFQHNARLQSWVSPNRSSKSGLNSHETGRCSVPEHNCQNGALESTQSHVMACQICQCRLPRVMLRTLN